MSYIITVSLQYTSYRYLYKILKDTIFAIFLNFWLYEKFLNFKTIANIKLEIGKNRKDCKVSMQYRGLTGVGLAQGKSVRIGAIPRLANVILRGLSGRKGE